jgi:hypothetical protein
MKRWFDYCLAAMTIGLTACVSPAEQKAADSKQCQGYGFSPGTDAFANCMMTISNRRTDQMRHWQEEQNRKWEQQEKSQQAAPSQPAAPTAMDCSTSETTTTTGNTTNVQSRTNCRSR